MIAVSLELPAASSARSLPAAGGAGMGTTAAKTAGRTGSVFRSFMDDCQAGDIGRGESRKPEQRQAPGERNPNDGLAAQTRGPVPAAVTVPLTPAWAFTQLGRSGATGSAAQEAAAGTQDLSGGSGSPSGSTVLSPWAGTAGPLVSDVALAQDDPALPALPILNVNPARGSRSATIPGAASELAFGVRWLTPGLAASSALPSVAAAVSSPADAPSVTAASPSPADDPKVATALPSAADVPGVAPVPPGPAAVPSGAAALPSPDAVPSVAPALSSPDAVPSVVPPLPGPAAVPRVAPALSSPAAVPSVAPALPSPAAVPSAAPALPNPAALAQDGGTPPGGDQAPPKRGEDSGTPHGPHTAVHDDGPSERQDTTIPASARDSSGTPEDDRSTPAPLRDASSPAGIAPKGGPPAMERPLDDRGEEAPPAQTDVGNAWNGAPPASADQNAQPAAPAPQPSAARPAELELSEPPAQPVSRDVSWHLADGDSSVDIRVAERAGEVSVTVHTPDRDLADSLRADLPDLVGKLRQGGFQAEVWRPAAVPSDAGRRHGSDAAPSQDQSPGDRRNGRQRPPLPQQPKNQSRWAGEWKSSLGPAQESHT